MRDFRADLHCHTTCSDGTVSPEDIVKLALKIGLKGLSITDHDTIEAYKTALPAAQAHQFPLISGVEFSTVHRGFSVHILAYSFSLHSKEIQDFCLRHHEQRLERNQKILNLLTAHGMPLTVEDLQDPTFPLPHTMGRPHIALAMIKKGYVSTIQEAFSKFIGEGKPCYVIGHYFTVEETIETIHRAKGLAVIAHPHLVDRTKIIRDLLTMDFDGIEGYYGRFPATEQEKWVKIGQQKGWLITGGSDFHGEIKPTLPLGSSWVNQDIFAILQDVFKRNNPDVL